MVKFYWNICSEVQERETSRSFRLLLSDWQTYKLKCMSFFSTCQSCQYFSTYCFQIRLLKLLITLQKNMFIFLKISLVAYYCLDIWLHVMDISFICCFVLVLRLEAQSFSDAEKVIIFKDLPPVLVLLT